MRGFRSARPAVDGDGVLVLPAFRLSAAQPKRPHVAKAIAHKAIPNEHGAAIEYTLHRSRNGQTWWLSASLDGFRMSNTVRTTRPALADAWKLAIESGKIRVAP